MLDDLKMIALRDKSDTLGLAEKQLSQLHSKFDLTIEHPDLRNVVFAGMGGSSLYAEMARSWPGVTVPYQIVKRYDIPDYVGKDTLFIASSFSGNTEETLSALAQAEEKGATIAIIAAGGKLAEIAEKKSYPLAKLNHDIPQPRMAAFEGYKALISILDAAGICHQRAKELDEVVEKLDGVTTQWRPDVPTSKNQAKQIALELMGRSIVVYAGPMLAPVDYKWKISFNENSKNVAWANTYPEINHNEFIGWTSHPTEKPYAIINLTSNLEHPRVQKRFVVSDRLLSGQRPHPITVEAQGETKLEQILWTTMLGDFVSIYLALLNGLDPEPVDLVEKFKKELSKDD